MLVKISCSGPSLNSGFFPASYKSYRLNNHFEDCYSSLNSSSSIMLSLDVFLDIVFIDNLSSLSPWLATLLLIYSMEEKVSLFWGGSWSRIWTLETPFGEWVFSTKKSGFYRFLTSGSSLMPFFTLTRELIYFWN